MITVLLADDSVVVRKSILRLLEDHTDIDVMAEATGFVKSIELILKLKPQVVVMDLYMRDQLYVTPEEIRLCLYGSRLIAISDGNNDEARALARAFGAVALLDKTNLAVELIPIIKQCATG